MKRTLVFFIGIFGFSISAASLAEAKVCAFDAGKIKLSPTAELEDKLNSLKCDKGDKVVVYQQAQHVPKIARNKMIGAQICNLEKPHTIASQGGNTNNHYVICEFSGTVLYVVTNDKFFEKAIK